MSWLSDYHPDSGTVYETGIDQIIAQALKAAQGGGAGGTPDRPLAAYSGTELRQLWRAGRISEDEWAQELVARGETVQSARDEIARQKAIGVDKTGNLTDAEARAVQVLTAAAVPQAQPLPPGTVSPSGALVSLTPPVVGAPPGAGVVPLGTTAGPVTPTPTIRDLEPYSSTELRLLWRAGRITEDDWAQELQRRGETAASARDEIARQKGIGIDSKGNLTASEARAVQALIAAVGDAGGTGAPAAGAPATGAGPAAPSKPPPVQFVEFADGHRGWAVNVGRDANGKTIWREVPRPPTPQGFSTEPGNPAAGWVWDPETRQYVRVAWNTDTQRFEPTGRTATEPQTIPLTPQGQALLTGKRVDAQGNPITPFGTLNPVPTEGFATTTSIGGGPTPIVPFAPDVLPEIPAMFTGGRGNLPISTFGVPDVNGTQGLVYSGLANFGPMFNSPTGGLGFDPRQILQAYGVKTSGDILGDTRKALSIMDMLATYTPAEVQARLAAQPTTDEFGVPVSNIYQTVRQIPGGGPWVATSREDQPGATSVLRQAQIAGIDFTPEELKLIRAAGGIEGLGAALAQSLNAGASAGATPTTDLQAALPDLGAQPPVPMAAGGIIATTRPTAVVDMATRQPLAVLSELGQPEVAAVQPVRPRRPPWYTPNSLASPPLGGGTPDVGPPPVPQPQPPPIGVGGMYTYAAGYTPYQVQQSEAPPAPDPFAGQDTNELLRQALIAIIKGGGIKAGQATADTARQAVEGLGRPIRIGGRIPTFAA